MIECVWEHKGEDSLVYAVNFPGAFARDADPERALKKLPEEVRCWCAWSGWPLPASLDPVIVQEKQSTLDIRDADSDVLFNREGLPLTREEYEILKALTMKSARDFHRLYEAIPHKDRTCLPERRCFYGAVPRTAEEMYRHTKSVNAYYFGEIDVEADNAGTIFDCRERGFHALEALPGFLEKLPWEGSYGELWSLRKVLRRFLWHDRIHGRAMYRMALRTFGKEGIPDVFGFEKAKKEEMKYGMDR